MSKCENTDHAMNTDHDVDYNVKTVIMSDEHMNSVVDWCEGCRRADGDMVKQIPEKIIDEWKDEVIRENDEFDEINHLCQLKVANKISRFDMGTLYEFLRLNYRDKLEHAEEISTANSKNVERNLAVQEATASVLDMKVRGEVEDE